MRWPRTEATLNEFLSRNNAYRDTDAHHGRIEVICGGMYSGKSEELIRRLRRVQYARRPFLLFKPARDNRYADDEVVTHLQDRLPCIAVAHAEEILSHLNSDTHIIGIDEVQFFGPEIVALCNTLAEQHVRVICAGLDRDSMNQPFGPMPELLATAEYVTKLMAVCTVCGRAAHFTQAIVKKEDVVLVGGAESYEARCREHFTPA
jgi:thymidine kinase